MMRTGVFRWPRRRAKAEPLHWAPSLLAHRVRLEVGGRVCGEAQRPVLKLDENICRYGPRKSLLLPDLVAKLSPILVP